MILSSPPPAAQHAGERALLAAFPNAVRGNFLNRADHVRKLVERLSRNGSQPLRFCYEAGPCGYGLHRQIIDLGHECVVVAPSLIPMKAGDRIKTDRRDAVMLAKLRRAGELTAVWFLMQPMRQCGIWSGRGQLQFGCWARRANTWRDSC